MSKLYNFETANTICDQFNRLINDLKERRKEGKKVKTSTMSLMIVMKENI